MNDSIRVYVVKYRDRDKLVMRYRCPTTGKQVARSTGTTKQKEAEKIAAKWEAELQEGRYQPGGRMGWDEFREFYNQHALAGVKPSTAANYDSTLDTFERLSRPAKLSDLTTARVTAFATALRGEQKRKLKSGEVKRYKLTEASVARHLRQLKAVTRWAHRQGLLTALPCFDIPKRASGAQRMKGRPITTEEFERMLTATAGVVGEKAAPAWKLFLRGLWTSGLRLGEALALRWDHTPGGVSVALDGHHSVLVFDGDAQKSGKAEAVPLAPEAVELLAPIAKRGGYVFQIVARDGEPASRRVLAVGRKLSAIGAAAGVVTDPAKGRTATAHDLRRAFGYRWSRRVMPATLRELMRHSTIDTTMTYYVGTDAKSTAGELWRAVGNNLGNTGAEAADDDSPQTKKALQKQG